MKTRLLLVALLLVQAASAQPSPRLRFNHQAFQEKTSIAAWMVDYDSVAWRMSELVTHASYEELGRMGKEWFLYKGQDSLWHGVYGKFKDSTYDLVLHYKLNENDTIDIDASNVDTVMLFSVSKAIRGAYREAGLILGKSSIRFNKFIRYNADKTTSVWLMPALQSLGIAVYGGEFFYHYDANGVLLDRQEYYQGNFKGFKTGKVREVRLHYEDVTDPTQGAVYFAMQFRKEFPNIFIDTRESSSMQTYDVHSGCSWRHADKLKTN